MHVLRLEYIALCGANFGRFGKQIGNTWKELKCGAGEDQLDRSREK